MKMGLATLGCSPVGDELAFASQLGERMRSKVGLMADPYIQVTLFGLGNGAAATH